MSGPPGATNGGTPLSWISRDARLIIAARGIRTFAQSSVGVIMALYLNELGFSILQIGVFLSVGVAGVAFFAFIVGLVAGRVERRSGVEAQRGAGLLKPGIGELRGLIAPIGVMEAPVTR